MSLSFSLSLRSCQISTRRLSATHLLLLETDALRGHVLGQDALVGRVDVGVDAAAELLRAVVLVEEVCVRQCK